MIRVFIGFDSNETVAYHALSQSIIENASQPVAITPIVLDHLHAIFERERHQLQSTEFAFSRFLVPYLCNYQGWAIFMDCDMIMLDDVAKLWALRDPQYAVMCVQHDHQPKETTKFLNQPQTTYEKKNWSSVMLMNCERCKALTKDYVNTATGLELHRFRWLEDESLIGALPAKWNHLVDYDDPTPSDELALLHYTNGGPYFRDYQNCGYNTEWFEHRERMMSATEVEDRDQVVNG